MGALQEIGFPQRKLASAINPLFSLYEFAGAPDYYSAGGSAYAKTATWIPAANFTAAVKASLMQTAANIGFGANASLTGYSNYQYILPPLAVKGSTISAFALRNVAVAISASGVQTGPLVLSQYSNAQPILTYDGSNFWCFSLNAAGTGLAASSSPEAITFTAQAVAGAPAFDSTWLSYATGYGSALTSPLLGEMHQSSNLTFAQFCGARFVVIAGATGSYLVATQSTNGTTFTGDQSTAVLGSATISKSAGNWWFYRNANTTFIYMSGQIARYSTDGGITFASTATLVGTTTISNFRVNASDPTRVCGYNGGSLTAYFSVTSCSTWVSVTLPAAATSICGRGSTWLMTDALGLIYISTNDGSTWAQVNVGAASVPLCVMADANRFYVYCNGSSQVGTSVAGSVWIVRNISNPVSFTPTHLAATDANTILITGNNAYALSSSDGGLTWTFGYPFNNSSPPTSYSLRAASTGSNVFLMAGGSYAIQASELAAPAYLRLGNTPVTPTHANAATYGKVG